MKRLLIIMFSLIAEINAARILAVFPTPSISHQVVFRPLTQELVRRGHQLTVITTDPLYTKENSPANMTEIDLHDVSYKIWRETIKSDETLFGKEESIYTQLEKLGGLLGIITEAQIKTPEVQNIINQGDKTYDLLILEEIARPYLVLSHIFKAPVILVSSMGMMFHSNEIVGAPGHIFLYPTILQQRLCNLTFWQKLDEAYKYFILSNMWLKLQSEQLKRLENVLGGDIPPYSELDKNVDMVFFNIHPMWSNNRPLPSNVISIWGIHKKPEKALPQDLQSYLDSSKNGVIYLSFGTNILSSVLSPESIQLFINVFSRLPYDVLWKWELDDLPGKSKNIRISKWLPQPDLLRHPNLKLFITQGGLQSTEEAINAGVPLVGIPMLADQWYNVEMYKHHGIGVRLDFETLSEGALDEAIETVINDKSYRENVIRLRSLMNDQPESALEHAVWWTEYVLRHGGAKHLRTRAANMPWTQYYEIEFVLTLAIIFIFILTIILYIFYLILQSNTTNIKWKVS